MTAQNQLSGGRFLFADATPQEIFTPEDFSPEQRQIIEMTRKFAIQSIAPVIDRIEGKDFGLLRQLMQQAGELGLLAVDVPEQYGGLQMGKVTAALIAERISVCASFSVTFLSHSGIGLLPLLWYGTPEQKRKYLPGIVSGQTIAAYALSEGSSGSDALNIRASAVLSADGSHYVLNGEKMWISNAGLANLFTIFAKIDGRQFTAFLVDRNSPGLSIGKEEHKMGIRGSSTCPVVLRDCRVPVNNLLGQAGKGHHIAFNVLNAGRYKLGAMVLGGARYALEDALAYGKQRTAFGKSITEFGLVQEKLAESAAMLYVAEALVYRTAGSIDASLRDLNPLDAGYAELVQSHIADYAVECSIVKVWCSEMQSTIVDHVMQIYGGYGFTEDYPAARHYRDARINRIFEGTNEINRLIICNWTGKATRETLAAFREEPTTTPERQTDENEPFAELALLLRKMKRIVCKGLLLAQKRYGVGFAEIQELAGAFADMIAEVYALESALLRVSKHTSTESGDLVAYFAGIARRRFTYSAEKIFSHVEPEDAATTGAELFVPSHRALADRVTIGRRIVTRMLAN